MATRTNTRSNMALRVLTQLQAELARYTGWHPGNIEGAGLPLPAFYFDATHNGRVYRVRVSDITPEEGT